MTKTEVTLKKIVTSNIEFDNIKQIYLSAFPKCERRNADDWCRLIDTNPALSLFAICQSPSPTPIGFITSWDFPNFVYIEHFAISEKVRNGGFGTLSIQKFLRFVPKSKTVVLEAELPESSPMASRRISFYQRQGFILLPYDYKQPPYSPGEEMLDLKIMASMPIASRSQFESIIKSIHSEVYGYGACPYK